ncbi:IS66 family insertion sequence element accessory protein TnpB [Rhizobium beringeri]
MIWHDGQGACLFTKKIGTRPVYLAECREGGAVAITPAQLSYLLSGIDWRAPQETWRPTRV